jgi:hypothetical protein
MYDLKILSNFGLDFNYKTEKPCELYVDRIPSTSKNCVRVLWVIEPNEISNLRENIIKNYNQFDLILTYDQFIISSCPNTKLFPYGTTWINNFDLTIEKEFCITTLIGGKSNCEGHKLRHSLLEKSKFINSIPLHLYNSSNFPITGYPEMKKIKSTLWKNELFYSQYHIVIENITYNNLFTEKLIDCFQTKTIPIYIGCKNIGDYFDLRGMFHIKNLDEMVDVCNNIKTTTYQEMITYVEINYKKSFDYCDFRNRLSEEINLLLNKTVLH